MIGSLVPNMQYREPVPEGARGEGKSIVREVLALAVAPTPAFFAETGSGDRPAGWLLILCLLVCAVLGAALWSVLDRRHWKDGYRRGGRREWIRCGR